MTNTAPEAQKPLTQPYRLSIFWLTFGMFAAIVVVELITSADAVFSYLYIGPILLANLRLNRRIALGLTVLASLLTLGNLWLPGSDNVTLPTLENRLIAVAALAVTEVLSHRNRCYEESIAQQRAQLQFQEKLAGLRQDFVATLTHDLKTPLLGAIETLRALQQERFGPVTPEQQRVFATMSRSHQASLQLVETVLDIYRNDAEGVELQCTQVDLVELTNQVIEALRELAANYQVSLRLNLPTAYPQALWAQSDALQLRRVLSNLLVNAIHHSPIGGRVDVMLSALADGSLQVEVLDQGPGISSQELPDLFERFYQGQSNRQAKGSGLGLYLSRQIVKAHGGTIWAENRSSQGAIFGFTLPAASVQSLLP